MLINGVAFVWLYPEASFPTELSFIQVYASIIWERFFFPPLDIFLPFKTVVSIKIYCIQQKLPLFFSGSSSWLLRRWLEIWSWLLIMRS